MLYRYFLILVAMAAVLVGVQIPNFVVQYEQRLDAHMAEVKANLKGFQAIADRFHAGSLDALILQHERSPDATFRAEADPIKRMVNRLRGYELQRIGLGSDLPSKVAYLLTRGDRDLLEETRDAYSFNVPMTTEAVVAGGIFAALVLLVVEILAGFLRLLLSPRARPGIYRPAR